MRHVRALLRDRRRRQRGSVLSGVLIILAFLSIVVGAVMTELSTNLILSHRLVTRVSDEATVDSAVESTLNQLQNTPLGAPCPAPAAVSLNGGTAVASLVSCSPTVDSRSPQFTQIASAKPFAIDGTHVSLPPAGVDEYLVADSSANLYAFHFGQSSAAWSYQVQGSLTGPPTAMLDLSNSPATILDLVPVNGSACGGPACVAVLQEVPGRTPTAQCTLPAAGKVSAQPTRGANFPGLAFFGDTSGTLFVYAPDQDSNCASLAQAAVGQTIVAGPIVFPGAILSRRSANDEIYFVTSDGTSSHLVHVTFTGGKAGPSLQLDASLTLPAPNAVGITSQSGSLPSRMAITFAGGQVALVQIQADFSMSLVAGATIPASISAPPFWCACAGGDQIGVVGHNGLYLFDGGLGAAGTYAVSGTSINTAPSADAAGEWFFGGDDGFVYEIVRSGTTMTLARRFGRLGDHTGAAVSLGTCPTGLCLYTASRDGRAFLVKLDARDAVVTACLSSAPPACNGANPRLWASVEVGVMGSPQTVHVTGWSYYSP